MTRIFIVIAAILAGLAVGAGAFASHALKEKLTDRALEIFETGARYQMYHALALLMVALLLTRAETSQNFLTASGSAFIRPLAKVVAGVRWGLKLCDRSPAFCAHPG